MSNKYIILEESLRLLRPGGEIAMVDWKKESMSDSPPLTLRVVPETVESQLEKVGLDDISVYADLPKHFLVADKKTDIS